MEKSYLEKTLEQSIHFEASQRCSCSTAEVQQKTLVFTARPFHIFTLNPIKYIVTLCWLTKTIPFTNID